MFRAIVSVMDPFTYDSPSEVFERVSVLLGCSPTSEEVAAYLDKHDELHLMRDRFWMPKIGDLPPCELSVRV